MRAGLLRRNRCRRRWPRGYQIVWLELRRVNWTSGEPARRRPTAPPRAGIAGGYGHRGKSFEHRKTNLAAACSIESILVSNRSPAESSRQLKDGPQPLRYNNNKAAMKPARAIRYQPKMMKRSEEHT